MLVAIDGPAGAGKSTVARAVARHLGFTYLDTGAMYRCVGLRALADPATPPAAHAAAADIAFPAEGVVLLDGRDVSAEIRRPEASQQASRVAADAGVREALVAAQRALVGEGDWVAEGRDIGTVVAPWAELKVFLTASDEERARRRAADTGEDVAVVLDAQRERDARDRGREASPLRAADDAVELDTTGLPVEAVVERIARMAEERRGR